MHKFQQNTLYPQLWQIYGDNLLRYPDLCYVNPAHHKLKKDLHSIIGCEPIINFKGMVIVKSVTSEVKSILLALVP